MMDLEKGPGTTWLWLALIALFFVALVAWFTDPLGWADDLQPAQQTVAAANPTSDEWVVRPDGPAVPVTLPEVPVKVVPADAGTGAAG
jgi:hypothetical protein